MIGEIIYNSVRASSILLAIIESLVVLALLATLVNKRAIIIIAITLLRGLVLLC